jgi:hypothetical protein
MIKVMIRSDFCIRRSTFETLFRSIWASFERLLTSFERLLTSFERLLTSFVAVGGEICTLSAHFLHGFRRFCTLCARFLHTLCTVFEPNRNKKHRSHISRECEITFHAKKACRSSAKVCRECAQSVQIGLKSFRKCADLGVTSLNFNKLSKKDLFFTISNILSLLS